MSITLADVVITQAAVTPDIDNLTTGAINGTGVFDILMAATKLHLQEEFDSQRITGKEYSVVYLGAIESVMSQAVNFIAGEQAATKIEADVGLARQKTVTELAQTDDTLPSGLGFNATTAIKGLVEEQSLINAQQLLVAQNEVLKGTAEIGLINQKTVTELAQTDVDIPAGLGYNNGLVVDGLVAAQVAKVVSDDALVKQKVQTELANTADVVIAGYAKNASAVIGGLMKQQIDKSGAEVDLLNQKTVTELAQTDDVVIAGFGLSSNVAVTGVVGKQKLLFAAQTNGFARDAEQKLTKIMIDTLTAQLASDASIPIPTNLANASLDAVLVKAKAGIGV